MRTRLSKEGREEGRRRSRPALNSRRRLSMTMQSVSLSALEASSTNPRRKIDRKTIEGLAASIRTDGLLHNLVVSPVQGQGDRFRIVVGERRYLALRLLEDRGELP